MTSRTGGFPDPDAAADLSGRFAPMAPVASPPPFPSVPAASDGAPLGWTGLPGASSEVLGGWQIVPPAADVQDCGPQALPRVSSPGGAALQEPAAGAGSVPLRCWLALPQGAPPRGGVLVLPEVFGLNPWVCSVADRLAAAGYAALAVPLFARTSPDLALAYDEDSLRLGRSHKERTSADALLNDMAQAADWLSARLPDPSAPLGCVGFCFGGHVAMLAATLPCIAASCDFYGAGVVTGRPGGGPPTLSLLPEIGGRLLCLCGEDDPLIPPQDVRAIEAALAAVPRPERHLLIRVPAAGHGFMCEARSDFQPEAAARGWQALLSFLADTLDASGSSAATAPPSQGSPA